ncbi:MAG: DNA polymerase III subunit delta [Peptococcaceae bacterium]|jgi:DNA polymerase-3 subunit delta|nr:DNA polymerase III subunit delta [Peptococcaceae bacterium]MDH7524490.1 DNA polymerase III subunit delta [Peptococcaceae bacterium]
MQYQKLINSIERGVVAPVYLICGEEEYLQEQLVRRLKESLLGHETGAFNFDELDGEKATPGQVVASANTLPVFADKRLVLVKNPAFLAPKKKEGEEDTHTRQEEALLKYLADPLVSTCLVLWVKGPVDKRKKIVKVLEKAGALVEINALKGADLSGWLKEEARGLGKVIEPPALEYILFNGGSELRFLKAELEKMALYAGEEKRITLDMAKQLLTKTGEASIFVLVDSIGQKKGESALLELRRLMEAGEPPVRILFMIARHFRLLLQAKEMGQKGLNEKQAAAALSTPPFVAGKLLRQSGNFSFPELENAMRHILEGDVLMKTGSPPRQVLENLVLELVGIK